MRARFSSHKGVVQSPHARNKLCDMNAAHASKGIARRRYIDPSTLLLLLLYVEYDLYGSFPKSGDPVI